MNQQLIIDSEIFTIDKVNKILYSQATYNLEKKTGKVVALNSMNAKKVVEFFQIDLVEYKISIVDNVVIIDND